MDRYRVEFRNPKGNIRSTHLDANGLVDAIGKAKKEQSMLFDDAAEFEPVIAAKITEECTLYVRYC